MSCSRSRKTSCSRWRAGRSPNNAWTITAPRVRFGRGAVRHVGADADELGSRVLFVCTPTLRQSEHARRVRASLGRLKVAEFTEVAPHVPMEAANAARILAVANRVDVVVALGGGSAIGIAKAVALPGLDPPIDPVPAIIAIPTTYAGSEQTPTVGITDRAARRKRVVRDAQVLPQLAIYDPELTIDLAPALTASTAMNALAHCVEAAYDANASPIVAVVAREGIATITSALPRVVERLSDLEAREDLLRGAFLAGFSIANASMALHHGLCHVLGARTGIAHGVANAILLPHAMRLNRTFVRGSFQAEDAAALLATLPIPQRLRDAGVDADVLVAVAEEAAVSATVRANPRPVTEADLLALLEAAW